MIDPISLTILGFAIFGGGVAAKAAYDEEENPKNRQRLKAADAGLKTTGAIVSLASAAIALQNQNSSASSTPTQNLPSMPQLTNSSLANPTNFSNYLNNLGGGGFGGC
jgi:hypothetical protein